MTSEELIEGLRQTGTGEPKLLNAQEYLDGHPSATPAEMVAALEAQGAVLKAHGAGWPAGTVAKARHLLAGKSITELLGNPPKLGEESRERRLVKEIFDKLKDGDFIGRHADKQAEMSARGVGNPRATVPEGAKSAKG